MIEVHNLSKYYGSLCAVDKIDFTIAPGEIVGLLGPNGAGKTTTLRMLTGFLQPSEGTIRVNDLDIGTDPIAIRQRMGYLPESAPLYPDMLVLDYLGFVAAIRGLAVKDRAGRIGQVAELCSLREVMHQPIGELSKGYRQRVGLAHALLADPPILVLDEPTSGLDPNQIVEIRGIIRRIGREKTIVFSTHILSEAEATCDRLIIIHQGRIAADGATAELKDGAQGERTIHVRLTGATAEALTGLMANIDGIGEIRVAETPTGLDAQIGCTGAADLRPAVYQVLKQTDWTVLAFYQQVQSLEAIFAQLTAEN